MHSPWRAAVVGFNDFERSAIESCLRLGAQRLPIDCQVSDVQQADLVIADADNASVLALLRSAHLLQYTLAIGAQAVDGCLAQLPRPINPQQLMRTLEGLCAERTPRSVEPAPAPSLPAPAAAPARKRGRFDHVLIVDPDAAVLRFMAVHLSRFGFEVHLARSGEDALLTVTEVACTFVFHELHLPGLDGIELARQIKLRSLAMDRRSPHVVLLTGRAGRLDKLRAGLAGCDAFLAKPLSHRALMAVIGDRVVSNATMAETALAPLIG